jgi:phospholipid-binding lipoprotein MlaA
MKLVRSAAPRALAALALALSLGGCATVANPNPRDPWEGFNRPVHDFNEGVDRIVLRPVATLYREKVPPLVRTGVANFFGNLSDVWSFVNSALQFKLQNATENFARVQINTMFGLFGIFDVASELNIDRHSEDFGQTLGHWGMPSGPYLVLPLLGSSTLRDAAALPIDRRFDLAQRIQSENLQHTVYVVRAVDRRSNLLRVGNVLEEAALDKYSFTRDAHLQRRRAEVFEREDDPRAIPPPPPPEEPAARPSSAPASAPAR